VADTPTGTRFRMLETVREFSTDQREAAGDTDQVLDRFLAWARDFGVAHHDTAFGADPSRRWTVAPVAAVVALLLLPLTAARGVSSGGRPG
jgi:hypothetical protein